MSGKLGRVAALGVGLLGAATFVVLSPSSAQQEKTASETNPLGWMALSAEDRSPEGLEPYLEKHPDDADRRTAALIWYSRRQFDPERLKHHTFEMIKHHPASMHIHFENVSLFYREPEYRDKVIKALEDQVKQGGADHRIHWILAMACEQGAVPRTFDDAESRKRFLRYFQLPDDTKLPTKLNEELADKALRYYRLAIDGAEAESKKLYSTQAVKLFATLEKPREGVEFGRAMFKSVPSLREEAGFLYAFGRSLKDIGETNEAVKTLKRVRPLDKEGFDGGAACTTMRAELLLGEAALSAGDTKLAAKHLLASVDVQRCCHNSTQGVSLGLAERLLDVGERRTVIEFCEQALNKFVPGQPETKALLDRARADAGNEPDR